MTIRDVSTTLLLAALTWSEVNSSSNNFLQLPLVPHRSQARRRLQTTPGITQKSRQPDRPQHYRERRNLKVDKALQVGALYQGYGTHYVDLWVGTPPQRQTLIVDTGSGVTAFPCGECEDCGEGHHIDDYFMSEESSTFHKVPCGQCTRGSCSNKNNPEADCRISMSYQEGSSWHAYEARDQCYIGGPHDHGLEKDNDGTSDLDPEHAKAFAFDMMFGCQTRLTGLFKTQLADGIMGMDNVKQAFWSQMHESKIMDTKEFSLCFTRQPMAEKDGTEAGAMTMGGYDAKLHKTPLVFSTTKGYGSRGFFAVHMRKVYLRKGGGGDSATSTDTNLQVEALDVAESVLNSGSIIVDSGTTDTYFNRRIAGAFKETFEKMTGKKYNHEPVELTEAELNHLPTILFQIAGDEAFNQGLFKDQEPEEVVGLAKTLDPDHPFDLILALPPSHYMEFDDNKGKYVARFYVDEGSGSVLGANVMMGHDVYFDVDNQRIGWAESDCDYTHTVSNEGFDVSGFPDLEEEDGGTAEKKDDEKSESEGKSGDDDEVGGNDDDDDDDDGETLPDETHDHDKTTDDVKQTIHPAVNACSDFACRGTVAFLMIAMCLFGVCCGRYVFNPTPKRGKGHSELEMYGNGGYRDDPEVDALVPPSSNGKGKFRDEP